MAIGVLTESYGLIFPLTSQTYDRQHNLTTFNSAWSSGWQIIDYIDYANVHFMGVPVAPHWFLSARHIQSASPTISYKGSSFTVDTSYVNTHPNNPAIPEYGIESLDGSDLCLVKVVQSFADYAAVKKGPVTINEICTNWGQGNTTDISGVPVNDSGGVMRGWFRQNSTGGGDTGLRWGKLINTQQGQATGRLAWYWTSQYPGVGQDCAGLTIGDSGGPTFSWNAQLNRQEVAGITYNGTYYGTFVASYPNARDCPGAYLWSVANLYQCYTANPLLPSDVARNSENAISVVYEHLTSIYSLISPPVQLATVAAVPYQQYVFGGSYASASTATTIDTSAVPSSAPNAVYQQIKYCSGNNSITFVASNLLQTETYHIRFHFASVPFGLSDYNQVNLNATVTDASGNHSSSNYTPYRSGLYKASVIDMPYTLVPNGANQITGSVSPNPGFGTYAVLSAIEITRNP